MRPSAEQQLPVGFELGAYRIVQCVGVGGMGAVYEAEHRGLQKRVALKTLYGAAAAHPESRGRFIREGKTASKIRHPHVVDITDVGQVNGVAYLVMELLDGEALSALIAREGALPIEQIADIAIPVIAAVGEAHRLGVVHRDLKPDNIFLTRSVVGAIHPKVLDFGISKVLDDHLSPNLTATNSFLGTPHYVPPEQARGSKLATGKGDQYSLGVLLYEAATGVNPFAKNDSLMSILHAINNGLYAKPSALRPNLDPRLEHIILKSMALSEDERFESMFVMGAELVELAGDDVRAAWARFFEPFSSRRSGSLPSPPASTPVPEDLSAAGTLSPAASTLPSAAGRSRIVPLVLAALALFGGVAVAGTLLLDDGLAVSPVDSPNGEAAAVEAQTAPPAHSDPKSVVTGTDTPVAAAPAPDELAAAPTSTPGVPAASAVPASVIDADRRKSRPVARPKRQNKPTGQSSPAGSPQPDDRFGQRPQPPAKQGPSAIKTDNLNPWD